MSGGKEDEGHAEARSPRRNEKCFALDDITGAIVDAALKVHKALGPGLLESVYEVVLAKELERRGLGVQRQKAIAITYDGMVFDEGFRADLLINFGAPTIKEGLHRIVNQLSPSASPMPRMRGIRVNNLSKP